MKDINYYTTSLFAAGLYALFGYLSHVRLEHWMTFLIVTALIILLDLFPLQLPSGAMYSGSSVGFLFLLFHFGLPETVFSLLVSTMVTFIRLSVAGNWTKINWFRFFATMGMYFISILAALFVMNWVKDTSIILSAFLAVIAFECFNKGLYAGIQKGINGDSVLNYLRNTSREWLVPIIVSSIVLARLLLVEITDIRALVIEMIYTASFLFSILFFSNAYIKQISSREKRMEESNQRYRSLFEQNSDFIFSLDLDGRFQTIHPMCEKITGYKPEELSGQPFYSLFPKKQVARWMPFIDKARRGIPQNFDIEMQHKEGQIINLNVTCGANFRDDRIVGVYVIAKDITERKNAAKVIHHMAFYDSLTDLPNRRLFNERLEAALLEASVNKSLSAVILLDLDSFKFINDSLGHDFGDKVLKTISSQIESCIGKKDTLARLGGDEFILLLPNMSDRLQASSTADKILEALGQPFSIDEHELMITTSMGIAIYPDDGTDVETLIKHADTAMYMSKEKGKNNYKFFSVDMKNEFFRKLDMQKHLKKALEQEQFILHYQPQLDIGTGRVEGVEALIRWVHPEKGLIFPGEFIAIAEETGLIIEIGDWVLKAACGQAKAWQDAGYKPLPISVNLSLRQFQDEQLAAKIAMLLEISGLDPKWLELEITESIFMEDVDSIMKTLNQLKLMGLNIVIDDFGTGYSALSYLTRIPTDKLKLDKSFVQNIGYNPRESAIAAALINLAHTLNIKVVAEGVDTGEKLGFLIDKHCDSIQGYLFSPPVPVESFGEFLSNDYKEFGQSKVKKA